MNIFVGASPPASNEGVWFKDGVDPFVWDADVNRWVSVGNRNMRETYKFGIMLERIDGWWEFYDNPRLCSLSYDVRSRPMWRVFSAGMHGPVMYTRRWAFIAWFVGRFFPWYRGGYGHH